MRRGPLVEWVDKTFFDRLNKLFMISARKRNHETLLIEENLLKLVRDPVSYFISSSLPHFAPKVVVPNKLYVVNDLPFYAEARATHKRKMLDRFAQREKKH